MRHTKITTPWYHIAWIVPARLIVVGPFHLMALIGEWADRVGDELTTIIPGLQTGPADEEDT